MPDAVTQIVDAQSHVALPTTFAMSKVVLEEIRPGEIRIRKAVAGRKPRNFLEESSTLSSDAGRHRFQQFFGRASRPNAALKKLMSRQGSKRGWKPLDKRRCMRVASSCGQIELDNFTTSSDSWQPSTNDVNSTTDYGLVQ